MSTDAHQNEQLRDHERRLAVIEYNLKRVMTQLRVDWEEPPADAGFPPEVLSYLAKGDKLNAIKALTQALGIGLAEAKAMVERGHR